MTCADVTCLEPLYLVCDNAHCKRTASYNDPGVQLCAEDDHGHTIYHENTTTTLSTNSALHHSSSTTCSIRSDGKHQTKALRLQPDAIRPQNLTEQQSLPIILNRPGPPSTSFQARRSLFLARLQRLISVPTKKARPISEPWLHRHCRRPRRVALGLLLLSATGLCTSA
jgi:hypothetical protein